MEINYRVTPTAWIVEAALNGRSSTAELQWIFGAGTLAFTPVGIDHDGHYFEHRVSWYSALGRPGMTMGHLSSKPASSAAALGQTQRAETIYRCFNCHATNVKPGPDLRAVRAGVQCERCHGPGSLHIKDPKGSQLRRDASIEACAECHRMPDPKALNPTAPEKADPVSIRFAPVGLMASKCFTAGGSLTCVTCHDPHGRPNSEPPAYERKCLGCHTAPSVGKCARPGNANCLGCHMKKSEVLPGLAFTDHRIRIYKEVE